MAQGVRAFASKPDYLSSVTGTHMVEGEDQLLRLSSGTHTLTHISSTVVKITPWLSRVQNIKQTEN